MHLIGGIRPSRATRPPKSAAWCAWGPVTRAMALALALSGCFNYVPQSTASLAASPSRIRLRLSEAGTAAVEPQLGAGIRDIEGRVESVVGDTLIITIEQMVTTKNSTINSAGGARILRGHVAETKLRVSNRRRSIGLAALIVAGGAGIVAGVTSVATGGSGPSQPPTTQP
jgi:enhancing lycopene biosynthesis protein 2